MEEEQHGEQRTEEDAIPEQHRNTRHTLNMKKLT